MKKSYNPFKMIGSYVGAIISLVYGVLAWKFFWFDINDIYVKLVPNASYYHLAPTHGLVTATILGFLIGYGINSLWRLFRK